MPKEVKPYSKTELANMYGISVHVFNIWIDEIQDLGEYKGRMYTPVQVQKIFNLLEGLEQTTS
jgi:hypothetical protein